jgi:uncharacterized protein
LFGGSTSTSILGRARTFRGALRKFRAGPEHDADRYSAVRQYSLAQIFGVWAAAAIPMGVLAWIIAPWLRDQLGGDEPLAQALLICITAGLIWQFVLVLILVRRELGGLQWSRVREALWLRPPRDPNTGRVGGRVWWWVLPFVVLFGLEELLSIPGPSVRDFADFLDSDAGEDFFRGAWGWFAVIVVLAVFNTVLGEELLFRGLLLPRMREACGKWDWVVNGALFVDVIPQPAGASRDEQACRSCRGHVRSGRTAAFLHGDRQPWRPALAPRRLGLMADGGEQPSTSNTDASPAPRSHWTAGRVIGMVFASIGGLIGLALLLGGIAVLVAYAFGRDDGYFTSDREQLDSATYAITTEDIDLGVDEADWAPDEILGNVRVQVEGEKLVFVGIGSDEDVDRYLGDVAHDELIDFDGDDPEFAPHEGIAPGTPPDDQAFWVAQSEGSGEQALTWDAEFGRWTAVVMNADATRGIDVEADVGVKLDWAIWAGLGMFVIGLLMSAGAVVVILLIGRRASRDSTTG